MLAGTERETGNGKEECDQDGSHDVDRLVCLIGSRRKRKPFRLPVPGAWMILTCVREISFVRAQKNDRPGGTVVSLKSDVFDQCVWAPPQVPQHALALPLQLPQQSDFLVAQAPIKRAAAERATIMKIRFIVLRLIMVVTGHKSVRRSLQSERRKIPFGCNPF